MIPNNIFPPSCEAQWRPDNAVIVFYAVNRDEDGKITSIRFNFVDADYFKANYKLIESPEE